MNSRQDLARLLFAIAAILLLAIGSIWVLLPFIGAAIWAGMVVIATWPLLIGLETRLRGRRGVAAAILVFALVLVLMLPLLLVTVTLASEAGRIGDWATHLPEMIPQVPPAWIVNIPLVGDDLHSAWLRLSQDGLTWRPQFTEAGRTVGRWLVAQAGNFGGALFQFFMIVVFTAVLYMRGEQVGSAILAFARRLAGQDGEESATLAGLAIRSVALGIVVTAIVQSALGGIGIAIAQVPYISLLTTLMFLLTLAQLGPLPVLLPAAGWLFMTGHTGAGIFLLVWAAFVGTIDNVLRPWLIKRGADMSFLLVFTGVLGGLLAFGMLGLFLGPVLLAVTWRLLTNWVVTGEVTVTPVAESPPPTVPDSAME